MSEIYFCSNCGSKLKGKGRFCVDCDSAEKRKKMKDEQHALETERAAKQESLV